MQKGFCKEKDTSNHALGKSQMTLNTSLLCTLYIQRFLIVSRTIQQIPKRTLYRQFLVLLTVILRRVLPHLFQTHGGSYRWGFTQTESVILPVFGYNSRYESWSACERIATWKCLYTACNISRFSLPRKWKVWEGGVNEVFRGVLSSHMIKSHEQYHIIKPDDTMKCFMNRVRPLCTLQISAEF